MGRNQSPEFIDQILAAYKDVPWKGEVVVRLGHADVKEDWERAKRMISEDGGKRKALELLGKPFIELSSLRARLFRASTYNPFSKTVHLFQNNLGILAHELGHHEDLETHGTRLRGLFAKLKREYRASQIAMQRLPDNQARKNAMKTLEPAFGTYIGATLGKWYSVGRLLFLFNQNAKKPLNTEPIQLRNVKGNALKEALLYNAVTMAPVILAHINARLPWRKSSFGYIFSGETGSGSAREGKKEEPSLKPHQVLVATASAKG